MSTSTRYNEYKPSLRVYSFFIGWSILWQTTCCMCLSDSGRSSKPDLTPSHFITFYGIKRSISIFRLSIYITAALCCCTSNWKQFVRGIRPGCYSNALRWISIMDCQHRVSHVHQHSYVVVEYSGNTPLGQKIRIKLISVLIIKPCHEHNRTNQAHSHTILRAQSLH